MPEFFKSFAALQTVNTASSIVRCCQNLCAVFSELYWSYSLHKKKNEMLYAWYTYRIIGIVEALPVDEQGWTCADIGQWLGATLLLSLPDCLLLAARHLCQNNSMYAIENKISLAMINPTNQIADTTHSRAHTTLFVFVLCDGHYPMITCWMLNIILALRASLVHLFLGTPNPF